jgi:tRNA modification GTPase
MLDRSRPLDHEDREIARLLADHRFLILLNKIDLPPQLSIESAQDILYGKPILEVSAKTGKGVDALEEAVVEIIGAMGSVAPEEPLLTNLRQQQAISKSHQGLIDAVKAMRECAPFELAAVDLREAVQSLDGMVGVDVSEDVLARVFGRFCIGK